MKAAQVFEAAARKLPAAVLSNLDTMTRLSALTEVKKAIGKMASDLEREKEDETDHRNWCIEDCSNTETVQELKNKDKDALTGKTVDLSATIDTLTSEIDTLAQSIADIQLQIKQAGGDREFKNREYKQTVTKQRASQQLLTEALNILKGCHDKTAKGVAMVQKQPASPLPPPRVQEL